MVESEEEKNESKANAKWYKNFGFDLYPNRRSGSTDSSFYDKLSFKHRYKMHCAMICESKVLSAVNENPLVKLLMGALENAGCPIDVKRHIVCEECSNLVTGGFDSELNQIVICENSLKARRVPAVTLIHELIHMYDYCTAKVDFKNIEHLACSEIRAANIAHCSFISSFLLGQSSPFRIKNTHQYCVKIKAAQSLMLSRNLSFEEAMGPILKVFDKCYNDLEPIGRRIRRNSLDPLLAYKEGVHLGFCKS